MKARTLCSLSLALCLAACSLPSTVLAEEDFAAKLTAEFGDPDRADQSYVRWWLPQASLTDAQLKEEIQEMYDSGFDGVELCMQTSEAPTEVYAYGSEMWAHKWKLMMNELLDHGMSVSLTSGTNWATSNVPGLDPDSQEASQVVAMGEAFLAPGETLTSLPQPPEMRESGAATFLGAYAYEVSSVGEGAFPSAVFYFPDKTYQLVVVKDQEPFDLTTLEITQGETVYEQNLSWTAPENEEGNQTYVVAFWQQGNYHTSNPSTETAYATNYFDPRGVDALKTFWEEHYLDDEALLAKIKEGDVMLFMDSIELTPQGGITWWTESMREEFQARKGYDILPYLFLVADLPQVYAVFNQYNPPAQGSKDIEGNSILREKVINDWVDVLTQLYEENLLAPLKTWLNSVGIKTRAQISYGRSFEITEPSAYVDFPEAENLNQYNQIDMFRLHTAGAKLQNKVLSTETGGTLTPYATDMQLRLKAVYPEYAAGFQKVIWHIWSATDSYGTEATLWPGNMPGFAGMFDRWDNREPAYADYDEFNAHIGRIQHLLKKGKSRTDLGFIHNNWNQGMNSFGGTESDISHMNNMLAHMGIYYRSTEAQDNGFTYDYLSPDLLTMDTVSYDAEKGTIEPAGYKALIIYQRWLDPDGASLILDLAKQGLPVILMENAAVETPFNDGRDEELANTLEELKALENVRVAAIHDAPEGFDYFSNEAAGYDDDVYEMLLELGVTPTVGYDGANHQLLTQTREDEEGNLFVYAYNYCSNDYHDKSLIEAVKTEDHGTNIRTNLVVEGSYQPYLIDAWTGEAKKVVLYEEKDGKTFVPIDLDVDDIALYCLRPSEEEELHALSTTAEDVVEKEGALYVKASESGTYETVLSNGETISTEAAVPESMSIQNWSLTVESWTQGENLVVDEEDIGDVHTVNSAYETQKTPITVNLEELATWDQIEEIGDTISGTGTYSATFTWDASAADGALLDFGDSLVSTMKVWINGQKVGGSYSENPSKAKASIAEGQEGKEQYTGGLNWIYPKADVSAYLVDGENTIEIVYNSTLGNEEFARGVASPAFSNWWGYDTMVDAYGPSQAILKPYVLTPAQS